MDDDMICPRCGEECWRDSVDVEVGVIHGPCGCPECGWSSDPHYDRSGGRSPASKEQPGWYVDQWGRAQRIEGIVDRCERFGLPRHIVEDAFREDNPVQPIDTILDPRD